MKAPRMNLIAHLERFFRRNGYVRVPDPDRLAKEGRRYKKGYEVRFVANTPAELRTIRELLKMAGFAVANAFEHAKQWRQPLYGRAAVTLFLELIKWKPGDQATEPPSASRTE